MSKSEKKPSNTNLIGVRTCSWHTKESGKKNSDTMKTKKRQISFNFLENEINDDGENRVTITE